MGWSETVRMDEDEIEGTSRPAEDRSGLHTIVEVVEAANVNRMDIDGPDMGMSSR